MPDVGESASKDEGLMRAQLYQKLEGTRHTLESFRDALAAATGGGLHADSARGPTPLEPPGERLLSAMGALDHARSLSAVLSTLVDLVAQEAPRVALFLLKDGAMHGWQVSGFREEASSLQFPVEAEGLFQRAVRSGEALITTDTGTLTPPEFAALPAPVVAIAVPLLLEGQPVAILYADDGGGRQGRTSAWSAAIQILSRHASANLAYLTAARTADVLRHWPAPCSSTPAVPGGIT